MTPEQFIEKYEAGIDSVGVGSAVRFSERQLYVGHAKAAADSFVRSLHFVGLGEYWIDLDWDVPKHAPQYRIAPNDHLAQRLERTMAYHTPWFSADDAKQLASDFYGLFGAGKLVRLTNRIGDGWTPITKSTFDAAYIAMDDERIGIICVEDED